MWYVSETVLENNYLSQHIHKHENKELVLVLVMKNVRKENCATSYNKVS